MLARRAMVEGDPVGGYLPSGSVAGVIDDLPSCEELRAAAQLFATMERPALLHCKSGADRSGFASALYLMLAENRPVAEARKQLALRYGHNRHSKTGVLDAFFDAYQRDTAIRPMPLLEWVETLYDPENITTEFRHSHQSL